MSKEKLKILRKKNGKKATEEESKTLNQKSERKTSKNPENTKKIVRINTKTLKYTIKMRCQKRQKQPP